MVEDGYPIFSVFHVQKYHTSNTCTHTHAWGGGWQGETETHTHTQREGGRERESKVIIVTRAQTMAWDYVVLITVLGYFSVR